MTRIPPVLVRRALLAVLAAALVGTVLGAGTAPPDSKTSPMSAPKPKAWTPPPGSEPRVTTKKDIVYIDGVPDTPGVFLPDTALLARVNDRRFTSRDFILTYYNAYAEDRPGRDSLGRVEWLNSMVNKEIMGRVAREANRPFTYEDRQQLRQHTQRVLSDVLFVRAVTDSVQVTEDDVRAVLADFKLEHHLRRLQFLDSPSANKARADLVAKRMTWEEAARRYRLPSDRSKPDGDIGWMGRMSLSYRGAKAIYPLKPGEMSPVVDEDEGSYLWQVVGVRPAPELNAKSVERFIRDQLRSERISSRANTLMDQMRREAGMQYDSANVAFAYPLFEPALSTEIDAHGSPTLHLNEGVPVIGSQDTARVLARYQGGQLTLGGFLQMYSDISPIARPNVTTPELFRRQVDAFALEPYKARMAEARGLDKDSLAVAMIEKERERILVEHMYRDSIESRIRLTPDEQRKYYQAHLARYFTFQTARFATFAFDDSAGAAAMADRLRKGEKAEDILRADSLAGRPGRGAIHEERENDTSIFHKTVFSQLKPGQATVERGQRGVWATIQLISMDPGRQLSFDEASGYVYDTLASLEAEKLLKAFLARHRKKFKIETRPQLVMRIRLVDPSSGI